MIEKVRWGEEIVSVARAYRSYHFCKKELDRLGIVQDVHS